MTEKKVKTLRVAAVQMESKNGLIDENLERATKLINQAARKGAKLILLPEFMPTGYLLTKSIWKAAEPKDGQTVKWLKKNSKRLKVWLGTSFLEADQDDFFNTFVLTTPDGQIANRVRKQKPALVEAYFTKGDSSPHVIDTELGKIGVGICYENMLYYLPRLMHQQSVDLILMPHSAPSLMVPSLMKSYIFTYKALEAYINTLKYAAQRMSRILGVPSIMVNKCGQWKTSLPGLLPNQDSSFPGLSSIADSDGTIKAQLNDVEGVLVEDVTLDPSRKIYKIPQSYGRWSLKLPWLFNLCPVIEFLGTLSYSLSPRRKKMAREISSCK